MKKAIVRLRRGIRIKSGYITLSDSIRNHYTLEVSRGFIELPPDAAKKLESDPRIIVEYPDGTTSGPKGKDGKFKGKPEKKSKKLTKTEITNLDKTEQINLLKKLGSNIIPKLESGRIKMILRLQ